MGSNTPAPSADINHYASGVLRIFDGRPFFASQFVVVCSFEADTLIPYKNKMNFQK